MLILTGRHNAHHAWGRRLGPDDQVVTYTWPEHWQDAEAVEMALAYLRGGGSR